MRKYIALILGFLLVISGAACDKTQDKKGTFGSMTDEELINYSVSVAEMKGHLRSSLAGLSIDDNLIAELHVQHPLEEGLISDISETLRSGDPDLADEVNSTFEGLSQAAADGEKEKVKSALNLLTKAQMSVVPKDKYNDVNFQIRVFKKLLSDINEIYKNTISDKGEFMGAEADYQDTYGFFLEAKAIYEQKIKAKIDSKKSSVIEAKLKNIENAFPSINLTQQPATPKYVNDNIGSLIIFLGK